MDVTYWKESLVKWINVTGILDEDILELNQLNDGKFIGRLLGLWRRKSDHGKGICKDEMNSIEVAHALQAFLKHEYPDYEFDLDAYQDQNEDEIIYVTSLLLFHCCLRKTDHSIIQKMNELPDEVQIVIKMFFERVLPEGNCITQKVLKDAICKEGRCQGY
ncbi:uncharacterized protein [Anabrus simplex]|uniref:uncharacterized protein n=1 Tax=Anabrus simplex TaxID=316456 RepID=UPI0035A31469